MTDHKHVWGEIRALAQRKDPVWMTELLHLLAQLPAHEQDAATHYIIRTRELPASWGRWQLEIQSVFELFLDAPLESFDATHRYLFYIMPDESSCQQLVEGLGYTWTDEHTPNPKMSEVLSQAAHFTRLPGDHPTSFYKLATSGHLVFDNDDWLKQHAAEYPSLPHAQSLCTFEDARQLLHDVPFFYESDEGRVHWWYNAATLWRVHTDGSLFDALWKAFRMDEFDPPDQLDDAVCEEARMDPEAHWLEIYAWHNNVSHPALREHLGKVLGEADGPWEQRARVFGEAGFGAPPGNRGCGLRISGHCSPKWPIDRGSEEDPGLGQFAQHSGLDDLESHVKGIASWVYAVHGNSLYGGMCIVACTQQVEEELAPRSR